MLSQTLALADSAGLDARLYTEFPDAAVSGLVGADAVHEWPVAVVALGPGTPALEAAGGAVAGVTDPDPVEFPIETAAQRAGDMDRLGEPWERAPAVAVPGHGTATVDEVITRRGSQRHMNPGRSLPRETLETCVTLALRGIDIEHWVAVHAVDGLQSGALIPGGGPDALIFTCVGVPANTSKAAGRPGEPTVIGKRNTPDAVRRRH